MKPNPHSQFDEGYYIVKNPSKCMDGAKVIHRSGYEKKLYESVDLDNSVVKWGTEVIKIKYLDPCDKKIHSYYPDLYLERLIDGVVRKFIIEVKAAAFLKRPEPPKVRSLKAVRIYNNNLRRYIKIVAKTKAVREFCLKNQMEFKFFSDNQFKELTKHNKTNR